MDRLTYAPYRIPHRGRPDKEWSWFRDVTVAACRIKPKTENSKPAILRDCQECWLWGSCTKDILAIQSLSRKVTVWSGSLPTTSESPAALGRLQPVPHCMQKQLDWTLAPIRMSKKREEPMAILTAFLEWKNICIGTLTTMQVKCMPCWKSRVVGSRERGGTLPALGSY